MTKAQLITEDNSMERFLTVLVASLCISPLGFMSGAYVVDWMTKDAGGGSDDQMAYGYFMILAGLALGAISFFIVWYLAQRFLVADYLNYLQIADGIVLAGWLTVWLIHSAQQPQRLLFDGRWAALEVEVRTEKSLLVNDLISSAISMDYIGGANSGNFPKPEAIREEGKFVILPWATAPMFVNKWQVRVFLHNEPMLFTLDLPRNPTQSSDWSGWVAPTQYQENVIPSDVQQKLTLRYRLRLVPNNEDYH
ncbi:hypothetical protein [Spirosoma endophyticum]|uniref:Uncharacterized protein n=1 Tax=Spirosoma endophyticum TaxID=662367 RepID=A0A1I1UFP9_9BACT|nr:hypothetical protein [Spirosoma endophyticum]SFD68438.1 hypothetical protein SAMN05216167_106215 [Spirosoma endophyticum]